MKKSLLRNKWEFDVHIAIEITNDGATVQCMECPENVTHDYYRIYIGTNPNPTCCCVKHINSLLLLFSSQYSPLSQYVAKTVFNKKGK